MANMYFVRSAGKIEGPFDTATMKQRAASGQLHQDDEVSRDQQSWTVARDVKGLAFNGGFDDLFGLAPIAPPQLPAPAPVTAPTVSPLKLQPCPDCAEQVSLRAYVCPHCGCPIGLPATPHPAPKFETLHAIAILYWVVAGILSAGAILLLLLTLSLFDQGDPKSLSALTALVVAVAGAISALATGGLIQLGLQIEENTRGADMAVRDRS